MIGRRASSRGPQSPQSPQRWIRDEGPGQLVHNWPLVLTRGIAALVFGVFAFGAPTLSLGLLVLLFGAYALADGLLAVASAVHARDGERWTMLLLEGMAGIVIGALAILRPTLTAMALLYLVAFWAILTGVMELGTAIRLRRRIDNEWLLALGGTASLGIGALLLIFPGPSALAFAFWLGSYAIIFGVLMVALGLRLWRWERHPVGEMPTLLHRTRTVG
jgi:uncharacterized membrane protein HdeD (DUF308 family)